MKASEALAKMNQARVEFDETCMEVILPDIFKRIEEAASSGMESILTYMPLSPSVIKNLQSLGYRVNPCDFFGCCISWQSWYKYYINL